MLKVKAVLNRIGVLLLLLTPYFLNAQDIESQNSPFPIHLKNQISWLKDTSGKLEVFEVTKINAWQKFQSVNSFGYTNARVWLKFWLRNKNASKITINHATIDYVRCYSVLNGKVLFIGEGGDQIGKELTFTIPKIVDSLEIYLSIESEMEMLLPIYLHSDESYSKQEYSVFFEFGLYIGTLLVMTLMSLSVFLGTREYGYALFAIHILVYGLSVLAYDGAAGKYIWSGNSWWINHSPMILMGVATFPVLLFARVFFNLKKINALFSHLLNLNLFINIGIVLFAIFGDDIAFIDQVVTINIFINLLVLIIMAIQLMKKGENYAVYFLIGWCSLLFFVGTYGGRNGGFLPDNWFTERSARLGTFIELLCLSLGISARIKTISKQEIFAQRALIGKMKEIDVMKDRVNEELTKRVQESTQQIEEKTKELQEKNIIILENKIIQLNLEALRSHLNPHFIFNSLNSIHYLISKKRFEKVEEFVSKYSTLMRMVFENAQKPYISIHDELEAIHLYVELEKVRLKESFKFNLELDSELDSEVIKIPTMMIQPFIENAIWHGLERNIEKGELILKISLLEETIEIMIKDNGKGIESVEEALSKRKGSIHMIRNRLDLLNKMEQMDTELSITTGSVTAEEPGTQVVFELPYK